MLFPSLCSSYLTKCKILNIRIRGPALFPPSLTHLTLVDPRVPGDDVLDLEDPVVLLLLLHQLEPRVRRERLNAVRQDVPVLPPDPRELFPGKERARKK